MTLRLYDEKTERTLVERSYPEAFFQDHGEIKECTTYLKPPYGSGFLS